MQKDKSKFSSTCKEQKSMGVVLQLLLESAGEEYWEVGESCLSLLFIAAMKH